MRNSPHFNIIANSSDILMASMDLRAESLNDVEIANSDGRDIYRSDRVVIQDSYIINTDGKNLWFPPTHPYRPSPDCVSFKPNSTNVVIQGLDCTGSHGISVGSMGRCADETDIVQNLYLYNVSLTNASDSARIKVWPGIQTSFQTLLNGGGGLRRIRNVTYDTFLLWAKEPNAVFGTSGEQGMDQAGDIVSKLMNFTQAKLTISEVTIKNMYGTTSGKKDLGLSTVRLQRAGSMQ
ncbi:unnamed protein product [Alternaria alternata]